MTSTMIAQSRLSVSRRLPSFRQDYDVTSELADRFDYQPTSNSRGLYIIGSLAEAFDVQPLSSEAPLVIETYANQIFGTYPGRARVRPTEIETRGAPQAFVWSFAKGFVWSSSLDDHAESTADLLVRIRAHLSLNTSELARTLGVERPTIYAWMRNAQIPRAEHRARLMTIGRLARFWTERHNEPAGKWRYAIVEENLTLVDVLSAPLLDEKSARRVLAALAERARATELPPMVRSAQAIRERARERGWQALEENSRQQVLRTLSFSKKK
jgi:transcriptional regulator with XRE-family HTH domain